MTPFADLLQQGASNAWLFIPTAILLGALHGLEPGHSKTMMAAFIVAIRGTAAQATMLGIAATVSHTAIVWVIALGGMYMWQDIAPEAFEPWLQLLSGIIIVAMALWMLRRVGEDRRRAAISAGRSEDGRQRSNHRGGHAAETTAHSHGHHHHGPAQGAHKHGDARRIGTGHGTIEVELFEEDVPPRWRVRTVAGQEWRAKDVALTTERPDGRMQRFSFAERGGLLESIDEIPEPHEFVARISLGHGNHTPDYDLSFVESTAHGHDHLHEEMRGLAVATDGYQDAHELAHANDIRRRFADRNITNWQILVFGLTGGLIPCPAAITVLLLCLQLNEVAVGATLVLGFSVGLALTLVAVGTAAAWSVAHASKRSSWFSTLALRAPYLSGVILVIVGTYVAIHGWTAISV